MSGPLLVPIDARISELGLIQLLADYRVAHGSYPSEIRFQDANQYVAYVLCVRAPIESANSLVGRPGISIPITGPPLAHVEAPDLERP